MLVVGYFYFHFFKSILAHDIDWSTLNQVLIFAGIAISIATLQDTTKTQNKFSKRIWENPVKGKFTLIVMSLTVLFLLIVGLAGMFSAQDSIHEEISFGLIVFAIGFMGLLKSGVEMFENHRLDKNPQR